MAIIPDEIRELDGMRNPEQIDTIHKYIKYMKEQMEFWASNREKEINNLKARVTALEDQED